MNREPMPPVSGASPVPEAGIKTLAALGDGRSVAIVGPGGSLDWWCVPDLDSPPLFDRLLDADTGGHFSITPVGPFKERRSYRNNSNVHETTFETGSGVARLTESLNSGPAGRLPWCELARRVEGVSGTVTLRLACVLGTRAGTASPTWRHDPRGWLFQVHRVNGALLSSHPLDEVDGNGRALTASVTVGAGQTVLLALVAGEDRPLVLPEMEEIDSRIETSDAAWRTWTETLRHHGPYGGSVRRSALALKLLLFSPSGAIAAAATSSLPERIGGPKNWDYRYAWIRDAAFTLDVFLELGFTQECAAAFTWLMHQVAGSGAKVCYTLRGDKVPPVHELPLPGYRGSRPVVIGNAATHQHQHGIYADLIVMATLFVGAGHLLDGGTAKTLAAVADECATQWRTKDSGIWELSDLQHYTLSKISAWQALRRAVELARDGHIDAKNIGRWQAERDEVAAFVAANCWSDAKQAYTFYAGTDRLDASLARAALAGFGPAGRLHGTCDAIRRELAHGPLLYRYTGAETQEGAFLACSFWLVEALARLGRHDEASSLMAELMERLHGGSGILSEMIDPATGTFLGNLPQGLSHLSLINAACALQR